MKVDGQSLLSSVYYQNQAGAREDVTDSKLHNIKPLEEISQTQVTHDISNPNTSFRIKDYFEPSSMLKKAKELQEVATDAFLALKNILIILPIPYIKPLSLTTMN
ncbi:MAG: hypothetical protein IJ950_01850 [Helicobacter sp.]|nr:hypothetical protein [Helicobacter sp.]